MLEKIKLFWASKIIPILKKIKSIWDGIVEVLTSQEFIYCFPLAVFAVMAFLLHSTIMAVVCFVWLIPVLYGIDKKNNEG